MLLPMLAAAAVAAACHGAADLPPTPAEIGLIQDGRMFDLRTDPGGMPLYTYDRDTDGKSNCHGACATEWRPVRAGSGAGVVGAWTTVRRRDGSRQWALGGRPVYTHVHDNPARPVGDGRDGVWRIVPPIDPRASGGC